MTPQKFSTEAPELYEWAPEKPPRNPYAWQAWAIFLGLAVGVPAILAGVATLFGK